MSSTTKLTKEQKYIRHWLYVVVAGMLGTCAFFSVFTIISLLLGA